jgi:DNA-binding TFAR19-related protein (PDSD5 family)
MTTIQIELPDAMVQTARAAGLLTPQALERLLTHALCRKQAADSLLAIAGRMAATGIEPISMENRHRSECRSGRA